MKKAGILAFLLLLSLSLGSATPPEKCTVSVSDIPNDPYYFPQYSLLYQPEIFITNPYSYPVTFNPGAKLYIRSPINHLEGYPQPVGGETYVSWYDSDKYSCALATQEIDALCRKKSMYASAGVNCDRLGPYGCAESFDNPDYVVPKSNFPDSYEMQNGVNYPVFTISDKITQIPAGGTITLTDAFALNIYLPDYVWSTSPQVTTPDEEFKKVFTAELSEDCIPVPVNPPVETEEECSDDQTIFKLFDETNSHVSKWNNANANVRVCYDELFSFPYTAPAGSDPHTCIPSGSSSPNNKVLRTDGVGANNVHVEGPDGTGNGYAPLCYGDLSCRLVTANPASSNPCSTSNGEALVASFLDVTNTHVSKGNDFNFAFKLCCKRSSGTPGKVCGDGNIDNPNDDEDTEVCDGAANNCAPGQTCKSDCRGCVVAPKIKLAEWRDANPVKEGEEYKYKIATKAALNSPIILFGDTENYNEGDVFEIEIFNTLDRSEPVNGPYSATLTDGKIEFDEPQDLIPSSLFNLVGNTLWQQVLTLQEVVGDAENGQSFTFKLSHIDPNTGIVDDSLESDPLQIDSRGIVVVTVNECSEINSAEFAGTNPTEAEDLCNKADSGPIPLRDPVYCKFGSETAKCRWESDKNLCANEISLVEPSGMIGTCSYTVEYKDVCTDGFRSANIDATYTGDADICENDCQDQVAQKIPCGRSFLSLPFFTAWQIVGAVIVLFLIYVILIKTGLIGKKDSKSKRVKKKK